MSESPLMPLPTLAGILATTEEELIALGRKGRIPKPVDGKLPIYPTIPNYVRLLRSGECTNTEAATILGKSKVWVGKLVADGYIKQDDNGRITKLGACLGYIDFLLDESRRSSKTASESEVKIARAREIELRIAQREGELIPIEDAQVAVSEAAGVVRSVMNGLSSRFTRNIDERERLQDLIDMALGEIADGIDRVELLAMARARQEAKAKAKPPPKAKAKPRGRPRKS